MGTLERENARLVSKVPDADLLSKHQERIQTLERQNLELSRKLASMSNQAAATASQSIQKERPAAAISTASNAQLRYVARRVEELSVGDAVRYQLQFVDVWNGQTRRSGWRKAIVAKLIQDPKDPEVVLKHPNGAMDCVEASRLLELQVAC